MTLMVSGRATGKLPAVPEGRLPMLDQVTRATAIPNQVNWRAEMPDDGIPMLGNDKWGCCFWATIMHYLQIAALYNGRPDPKPTTAETLAAYGQCTGFNPAAGPSGNNYTDVGTQVGGSRGGLEFWAKTGVVCGGVRNILSDAVQVKPRDLDYLKQALVYGPVQAGSEMSAADIQSPYMWNDLVGQIEGGHSWVCTGYEVVGGKSYFDVLTWNGEWRATDDWILRKLDEAVMLLDVAFFGRSGVSPSGIDVQAVRAGMTSLRA